MAHPWLLSLLLVAGCASSGFPELVDARWLAAGGNPRIKRIRDLGTRIPHPLDSGPLTGEPDGVASPGELLLIEGSGFGKQPTVTLSGRATEVIARTVGGGIVVALPPAVETGPQTVQVTVGDTRGDALFPFRRLAVAVHSDRAFVIDVSGESATPVGAPIDIPGARAVRISHDGACAYVLGSRKLVALDLGAPGGPRILTSRDLQVDAWTLVAAERAPLVIAVADGEAQAFQIRNPRQPGAWDKVALPAETRGARAVDIDPDGRRMAFLLPEGNRVTVVELPRAQDPPTLVATMSLLIDVRAPVVRDLRFAPDGETLWVAAGNNHSSIATGVQPSRVIGVRVEGAPGAATVAPWRTLTLSEAFAPVRLLVTRVAPPAGGSTIRMAPDQAQVFFTAASTELWQEKDAASVAGLIPGKTLSALDRVDFVAPGGGGHFFTTDLLLGGGDVAVNTAVIAAGRVVPGAREWGAFVVKVGSGARSAFLRLDRAIDADFTPPFALGDIRLQP